MQSLLPKLLFAGLHVGNVAGKPVMELYPQLGLERLRIVPGRTRPRMSR